MKRWKMEDKERRESFDFFGRRTSCLTFGLAPVHVDFGKCVQRKSYPKWLHAPNEPNCCLMWSHIIVIFPTCAPRPGANWGGIMYNSEPGPGRKETLIEGNNLQRSVVHFKTGPLVSRR